MCANVWSPSVVAAGTLVPLSITAAQAGTGGQPPPAGVVSATPASSTPRLATTSSPREQIRQIVRCGGTMYAVGSFSVIKQGSRSYCRTDIVSFSASQPVPGHVVGSPGGGQHEDR